MRSHKIMWILFLCWNVHSISLNVNISRMQRCVYCFFCLKWFDIIIKLFRFSLHILPLWDFFWLCDIFNSSIIFSHFCVVGSIWDYGSIRRFKAMCLTFLHWMNVNTLTCSQSLAFGMKVLFKCSNWCYNSFDCCCDH